MRVCLRKLLVLIGGVTVTHIKKESKYSSRQIRWFFIFVFIIGAGGCAEHYSATAIQDPYGFFSGIWHGMLFPFSTTANIIHWGFSFFGLEILSDIEIIGRPNTGWAYYLGFFVGILWPSSAYDRN